MQSRPIFSAEPFYHPVGRSYRQRNQKKKCEHPDGDKRSLPDVARNCRKRKTFVENAVGDEMQKAVKE